MIADQVRFGLSGTSIAIGTAFSVTDDVRGTLIAATALKLPAVISPVLCRSSVMLTPVAFGEPVSLLTPTAYINTAPGIAFGLLPDNVSLLFAE